MAATPRRDNTRAFRDVMGANRDPAGNLIDAIPPERFGKERARVVRKLVLLAIAKFADPDGSNAWPSRETIAHCCLISREAVRQTINWLADHGLLKVESKAGRSGRHGAPNRYSILLPTGTHPAQCTGDASQEHGQIENGLCPETEMGKNGGGHGQHWREDGQIENSPDRPLDQSIDHKAVFDGEEKAADPNFDSILKRIWDYYIQKTGKNPISNEFTTLRKKTGLARLKECFKKAGGDAENAEELMQLAIDSIAKSDWSMGRSPKTNGRKFCDWENHIFKSYEQMETWWNT
jgi:hypothetical protein